VSLPCPALRLGVRAHTGAPVGLVARRIRGRGRAWWPHR
jgi:hypothetical protein